MDETLAPRAIAAAKAHKGGGPARAALRARLEARREEIEQAAMIRTYAIADPAEAADPAYARGLREAVVTALDYGLATIDRGEAHDLPIPVELLAQARLAARNGIGLDTVLRRYFAGFSLLGYFMLEEVARDSLIRGAELQRLVAAQAGRFDRLLEAISEEHAREAEALALPSGERRRFKQIERLLAGEPADAVEIAYDLAGWHVGVVGDDARVERRLREVAAGLDCRLLCVSCEGRALWAWLGARRRLTHRQAPPCQPRAAGCSFGSEVPGALKIWLTSRRSIDHIGRDSVTST
jgi:hypothetical protein